jgi:uncharacterized ion transporter superfamily protein YfcC
MAVNGISDQDALDLGVCYPLGDSVSLTDQSLILAAQVAEFLSSGGRARADRFVHQNRVSIS